VCSNLPIVDEPTAGLDPEEHNRFHNLLVNLAQDKVATLSAHIVEDVLELCSNMAVLASGKITLQGNPISLIDNIKGKIWRKSCSLSEINEIEQNMPVISRRLFAGKMMLHVLAFAPRGRPTLWYHI